VWLLVVRVVEDYMAVQEEEVAHLEMDLTAEKVVMVRAD
jgi:hypothetical protein